MTYYLENEDSATIAVNVPDYLRGYISEPAYAHIRRTSVRTCQRERQLRKSPPFVRLGRRVFYRIEAVQTWLVSNEQGQTAARAPPEIGSRLASSWRPFMTPAIGPHAWHATQTMQIYAARKPRKNDNSTRVRRVALST